MNRTGLTFLFMLLLATTAGAQELDEAIQSPEEEVPEVPQAVEVTPLAEDSDIKTRLTRILIATEWFANPQVEVDEGVVFLRGVADNEQHREWASRLAGNTQDVVAVVNRMGLAEQPIWDMTPAWKELESLGAALVRNLPILVVGTALLVITWIVTVWAVRGARFLFGKRFKSQLLRDVVARAVAVPVFMVGLYLILKVSGLTRLAVTVLGGTGILGLVVGFAFRDIAENFLASILISMQRPFARGDFIKVADYQGLVQSVNTRSTLLMTLDGNHVQIPNATIYKETITNFSANPNARFDFTIGIGYEDSISEAQSLALKVLQEHSAVSAEPEPMVLVETLGASTVNLRVYCWVNVEEYSLIKVRSAVIRNVKTAFDDAEITMPDEAREVVFPAGVPVRMLEQPASPPPPVQKPTHPHEAMATSAEANLTSEVDEINEQAKKSRSPEAGADLLEES